MKAQTVILTAILAALPAAALAGPHDHSSPPARSDNAPRQESHQSAPQRSYSAPQRSYSEPQRSYSAAPQRSYSQPAQRYSGQPEQRNYQQQSRVDYQRTYSAPQRTYQQPEQRYYQSSNTRYSQGYSSDRRVQSMPRYRSGEVVRWGGDNGGWNRDPWYWHRGEAWYPEAGFWGGGFWGNFAIGLSLDSYSVQSDSPGAQLLANYGLTQGPCDQDNMVEIFGPDGSQICAYPNDLVAPGQYQIDMSTLSLVSM